MVLVMLKTVQHSPIVHVTTLVLPVVAMIRQLAPFTVYLVLTDYLSKATVPALSVALTIAIAVLRRLVELPMAVVGMPTTLYAFRNIKRKLRPRLLV
jgi:hypothetical protein